MRKSREELNRQHSDWCKRNRDKVNRYQRDWKKRNPDKLKKYSKEFHSRHRDKLVAKSKSYYHATREIRLARMKVERRALRKEMILAYGGECSCCGESRFQFLTLEHTRRDGNVERRLYGAGDQFFKRLKRMGWPKDGYTVLCMNCNWATRYGDQCPHKTIKNDALTAVQSSRYN